MRSKLSKGVVLNEFLCSECEHYFYTTSQYEPMTCPRCGWATWLITKVEVQDIKTKEENIISILY